MAGNVLAGGCGLVIGLLGGVSLTVLYGILRLREQCGEPGAGDAGEDGV